MVLLRKKSVKNIIKICQKSLPESMTFDNDYDRFLIDFERFLAVGYPINTSSFQ